MATMTQAKAMWCPMVRHYDSDSATFNRNADDNNPVNVDNNLKPIRARGLFSCNCISTQCMMWRWTMPERPEYGLGPLDEATRDGYCGLAGSGRV